MKRKHNDMDGTVVQQGSGDNGGDPNNDLYTALLSDESTSKGLKYSSATGQDMTTTPSEFWTAAQSVIMQQCVSMYAAADAHTHHPLETSAINTAHDPIQPATFTATAADLPV